MDANCPNGRARPRNVVARGQVADILCVDAGEIISTSRPADLLAPRWQDDVRIHNLRLLATSAEHS